MRDEELTRRFDTIDNRFEGIDHRFDAVYEHFAALDRRLDAFATKSDLERMSLEIRTHFDVVTEAFKAGTRCFNSSNQLSVT